MAGLADRLAPRLVAIGGSPLLGSYCATKAALIQLTRVAAVEMRAAGVRVNAV